MAPAGKSVAVAGVQLAHQMQVDHSEKNEFNLEAEGFSSIALNQAGKFVTFRMKKGEFGKVDRFRVHATIQSVSNTSVITDVYHLLEKVTFQLADSRDEDIKTMWADELWFTAGWSPRDEQRAENLNFYGDRGQANPTIGSGESREFFYDLPFDLFHQAHISGEHISHDLLVKLYLRNGVVVSGSGVPTLTAINARIRTIRHNDAGQAAAQFRMLRQGVRQLILDCRKVEAASTVTLTASTSRDISLDDISGNVAALFVVARAARSAASNGLVTCPSMGKAATVQILTKDSNQLWPTAAALPLELINQELGDQFIRDSRVVVVPFCSNIGAALASGVVEKYQHFPLSNGYKLRLTPAAAAQDPIVSFNLTNAANDGGFYRLQWAGESTISLAHDATIATMKSAFEALEVCKQNGLTVTFVGTAATDFTMTIHGANFDPVKRFGLPALAADSLNDGTVAERVTDVSVSTQYKDGSTVGGSAYLVDVYAWVWRVVTTGGASSTISAVDWA